MTLPGAPMVTFDPGDGPWRPRQSISSAWRFPPSRGTLHTRATTPRGDMNTEQAELFFSILTVTALAGTALLVMAVIGARRVAVLGQLADAVRAFAVPLAAVVAVTCMAGSLYFSEVAGFLPCTLCWYQRI